MSQISHRRRPTVRGSYATRLGAAGVMLATVFVLTAAPALADCPVTDPACLPGAPPDPVTAIADVTTEVAATASSAVDQTTTTVEQTAAAVQDHANQAVEPVTNTVKGIIGQVPDPDPIGDPTGILPNVLGSSVGQPSGPGTSGPGGSGKGNGTGTDPNGTATQGSGPSFLGRGPLIGPVAGPISANPAVSIAIPQQGLFDRIGSLATLAARALAFPVALALIVLLFVAVQNRIDRKDPKLALAPIAPDLLRFE
jgi:hypothetical protein